MVLARFTNHDVEYLKQCPIEDAAKSSRRLLTLYIRTVLEIFILFH